MFRNIIFYSVWIVLFQVGLPYLTVASVHVATSPSLTKQDVIKNFKQKIKRTKKATPKRKKNVFKDLLWLFLLAFGLGGSLLATIIWLFTKGTWIWWFLGGFGIGILTAFLILIFVGTF
jgi:sterol desaturase/sphingolipid hydroxylase (fatty acid hydroxylase superfamily)